MKKRLKYKILAGFMVLIIVLISAGIISIVEFTRLSHSVSSLIEDNYKTIEASKSMLEALEREDSGILMLLLGQWENGRKILSEADSAFMASFAIAQNNITEQNESELIDVIRKNYYIYKSKWQRPIVDTDKEGNIDWYQNTIHMDFLSTKESVHHLMSLNQNSMHDEAGQLIDRSHRAIMPGIVSIAAALIFTLILNFFITKYFISPISHLAEAVKKFNLKEKVLKVDIRSNDEIKQLENEINSLIFKISQPTEQN
jgi:HAMP domain-containing protein